MSTTNALMRDLTHAPHAVLPYFRDTSNACHEMSTNRLTPGTLRGCRAACGPAHMLLSSSATRLYADLIFSRSLLLCSLRTPNAQRLTLNGCVCTSLLYTHNRKQNSQLFPRLAPRATAQHYATPNEKASCRAEGWREAMVQFTNVVKPSSEAVPLHEGVRLEQRNKPLSHASITVWMGGLFRRGMHTPQCQGRRAERCNHRHTSISPYPHRTNCIALPVRVGAASATWARNKYTATIKIQSCSVVLLSACVKLGNQPHTTKSLTGGVQNTSLLRFSSSAWSFCGCVNIVKLSYYC